MITSRLHKLSIQTGPVEESAQAVKAAKFRLEAYAAYLEEQCRKLETEAERITGELLTRIKETA